VVDWAVMPNHEHPAHPEYLPDRCAAVEPACSQCRSPASPTPPEGAIAMMTDDGGGYAGKAPTHCAESPTCNVQCPAPSYSQTTFRSQRLNILVVWDLQSRGKASRLLSFRTQEDDGTKGKLHLCMTGESGIPVVENCSQRGTILLSKQSKS
jgi:Fe-S-cluster-containing hydrogenase component 2